MEDLFNNNPDDGFNPEDHGIENDEIAKIYALNDMKEDHNKWAINQALRFYSDFEALDIKKSIEEVTKSINAGDLKRSNVIETIDNMIAIFEDCEEYEKCSVCNKIKKGILNAKT
jgi:hypothetical protein